MDETFRMEENNNLPETSVLLDPSFNGEIGRQVNGLTISALQTISRYRLQDFPSEPVEVVVTQGYSEHAAYWKMARQASYHVDRWK